MKRSMIAVFCAAGLLMTAGAAQAAISIDTVPVGNPGNVGELSGQSVVPNYGPDRICGAVAYTYNIGKYEVTAGQYTAFLNAVAATDTYGLYNAKMWSHIYGCKIQQSGSSGSYTYSVAADYANRPVSHVSFWDACRFTNWLGNGQGNGDTETGAYTLNGYNDVDGSSIQRNAGWTWAVTSEDEWYKAAYHDKTAGLAATYFDYPTGSDTVPGQDQADASGNNANYKSTSVTVPPTVVGEFENSESPYGTFDQGGNVFEWNESVIGSDRGVRGGSFYNTAIYMLAANRYYDYVPTYESYNVGFRVVPEPATMALMALGGIGMLVSRKRSK